MLSRCSPLLLLVGALCGTAHAGAAPFDLAGPVLEVKITRGTTTLPAAEVPNLAAGDQIWMKADLPASQSAHYLLVAAFLSGSTNPPPEDVVFLVQDLDRQMRARRIHRHRAAGGAADTGVSRAGNRRRFQNADGGGSRATRRVRAHLPGSESGRVGPFAARALPLDDSRVERRGTRASSRRSRLCWRAASQSRWTRSAWTGFPNCRRLV